MHFESFDSLEAMQAAMRLAEEEANRLVTPQQAAITLGDHWARPMGEHYDYMWIVGRIFDLDELLAGQLFGARLPTDHHPTYLSRAQDLMLTASQRDHRRYNGTFAQAFTDGPDAFAAAALDIADQYQQDRYREGIPDPEYLDETVAEFISWAAIVIDTYQRGYRFGVAYSPAAPEGDLGDTHISQMVPITREEWDEAVAANHDVRPLFTKTSSAWCRILLTHSSLMQLYSREVH